MHHNVRRMKIRRLQLLDMCVGWKRQGMRTEYLWGNLFKHPYVTAVTGISSLICATKTLVFVNVNFKLRLRLGL
jgi:hypothetical protein